MKTYVLGAGASYPVYPLGGALFSAIDGYIKGCGRLINRFDYQNDWPKLIEWLKESPNPLLRQAFHTGNIEQIFTLLDLAESLHSDSQSSMFHAVKGGKAAVDEAVSHHDLFLADIGEYRSVRLKLLWAMEDYFLYRNEKDLGEFSAEKWRNLKRLGAILEPDDVVVTFNYDSTIERVLFQQGKWSPLDGYGPEVVLQRDRDDKSRVLFPPSVVRVLHLHGALGWYGKPVFNPEFDLSIPGGGPISRDDLSVAPLETEIALDNILLRGLGIYAVDASMPRRPPSDLQILLHPTFLKEYGGEDRRHLIFYRVWKMASKAIRDAEQVMIIGYSLPPADSAAWTLLHTNCERGRTTIVNPDKSVLNGRYGSLLKTPAFTPAMNLGQWLDTIGA